MLPVYFVVENRLRNDVMRLRVSVVESCGELSIPGKTKTGVTASRNRGKDEDSTVDGTRDI